MRLTHLVRLIGCKTAVKSQNHPGKTAVFRCAAWIRRFSTDCYYEPAGPEFLHNHLLFRTYLDLLTLVHKNMLSLYHKSSTMYILFPSHKEQIIYTGHDFIYKSKVSQGKTSKTPGACLSSSWSPAESHGRTQKVQYKKTQGGGIYRMISALYTNDFLFHWNTLTFQ